MRPPSAPAVRSDPSGRSRSSRERPGLVGAQSPPPFAVLPATLVLSQAVWQARADLPRGGIRVRNRDGDRVLVHQAGPKSLLDGRQLRFVAADPDEQSGLVDV